MKDYSRVLTPPHVWQLWVLSWCIRERKNPDKLPTLWVPDVVGRFKNYVDRGIFRVKRVPNPQEDPVAFPIYDFVKRLEELGYLLPFSSYKKKYYKIRTDRLHLLPTHKQNIYHCLAIEYYLYVPIEFRDIHSNYSQSVNKSIWAHDNR